MQIDGVGSQTSFRAMYVGKTIENRLAKPNCSEKFINKFEKIKKIINISGYAEKENVDIILNVEEGDKFFATVSSKKEGVPMHPHNKCAISNNPKSLEKFSCWLEAWNDNYNPEYLKALKEVVFTKRPH